MRSIVRWTLRLLCGLAWFAWFIDKPILAMLAIYWPLVLFVGRWERQPETPTRRAYNPPSPGPVAAAVSASQPVAAIPSVDATLIDDTINSLVALGEKKKQAQFLARSAVQRGATTLGEAIALAYRKQ